MHEKDLNLTEHRGEWMLVPLESGSVRVLRWNKNDPVKPRYQTHEAFCESMDIARNNIKKMIRHEAELAAYRKDHPVEYVE